MMAAASLVNPLTCGFAKVAAYQITSAPPAFKREPREGVNKFKARVLGAQYQEFLHTFRSRQDAFKIEYSEFTVRVLKLKETCKKWSRNKPEEKKAYFEEFKTEKWLKLSNAKKQQHTLAQCKGCHHAYTKLQATFPVHSNIMKQFAKENPFFQANNMPKLKPNILSDCTKEIYNTINKPFQRTFGISFGEAQTNVKELNLQMKPSKCERKAELRNMYKKAKRKIEDQWAENSVER